MTAAVLKGLLPTWAVDHNVVTTPGTAKFAHFTISPLMLCDDADVAVDYVLHMQYVYNVLLKDRRKKQFAICQTATLYYWTRKVVKSQVFPKNQRYRYNNSFISSGATIKKLECWLLFKYNNTVCQVSSLLRNAR